MRPKGEDDASEASGPWGGRDHRERLLHGCDVRAECGPIAERRAGSDRNGVSDADGDTDEHARRDAECPTVGGPVLRLGA